MKKEIGMTRFVEAHKFKGDFYVKVSDFNETIRELEEENKKLKSDLAFERTMLDNVRAEYKSLQNVIKKLKEENEIIMKNADDIAHHNVELMKKVKELEKKLGIE